VLRSSDGSLTRTSHYLIDTAHAWPQVIARRSTDTNSAGQTLSRQITAWHGTTGASATPTGDSLVRQVRIDAATGQSPGPVLQADLLPLAGHLGTSLGAVDAAGQVQEAVATDAFGQLRIPGSHSNPGGFTNAPVGGWQQSHLFAGEYWDQDAQLLYLRARWYDPQIGRFISADPFEGRQRDPRSFNRYSYAHGDPVQHTDPTGAFSMGEMSAGLNVQGVLANTARHSAFEFLQNRIFGGDDTLDGPESLYEMLVGTLMKSLVGSVTAPAGSGGGGSGFGGGGGSGGSGGVERHHVIPEYMCGAAKQVDLVNITVPEHRRLHPQMINFDRAITYGAKVYDVVFRKRQALELKSPINKLARTKKGRAVIAAALETFYYENDWFFAGRGQKSACASWFRSWL